MYINADVLIVGAGPTGLMMAAECTRYGLSCRIIDRGISYGDQSRAVVIQARTLEIFFQVGIAEPFLRQGIPLKAITSFNNRHPLFHLSLESLESPYPFALSLEQAKTEKILRAHVTSLGIPIEDGIEFLGFKETPKGIEATVLEKASGKEKMIYASYLIGCDGAHSSIRKQLGFPLQGRTFPHIFSLADVQVSWNFPHDEVSSFPEPHGVLAAIPLPEKDRYRLIFQLNRCDGTAGPLKDPTLEEIQELLSTYVGKEARVSDPRWMANFNINTRMSPSFHKGRIFLAGDAAHIHSPVGGQGMNTGIQDAFNLAWKLALVHKKQAPISLLDTYNSERHDLGKKLLKATERASIMATLKNLFLVRLRNFILILASRVPTLQSFMRSAISQISIHYPKSQIATDPSWFWEGPKSGSRAPNTPLMIRGNSSDLYSLSKGSKTFQLLLFSGPEHADLTVLAKEFSSPLITPVLITYGARAQAPSSDLQICADPSGRAHHQYGAHSSCIYVIRPDGYIAYRSQNINPTELSGFFKNFLVI